MGRIGTSFKFILLTAGIIAGCSPVARDLPTPLTLNPVGSEITGMFTIGEKGVPLPAGTWTVIGTQISKDGSRGFHTIHMLAKIEDKTVQSAVEIYANIPIRKSDPGGGADQGWVTHPNCTRDNMHFSKVHANVRLGEQDCWWVNHWRMNRSGSGNTEHWMESRKYLADNRIAAPLDMVAVSYRLANKAGYLTINYFFNPEISGFAAEKDIHWSINTWETSFWHPDQIKADERKQAYGHLEKCPDEPEPGQRTSPGLGILAFGRS